MSKKTYWEKLKDPRWQRKRLEALEAAEFSCQICYDHESTLHVHHKAYFKGREPWEYEIAQLAVLCESCHEQQHAAEDELNLVCSRLPLEGPESRSDVACLVAGFNDQDIPPSNEQFHYLGGYLARVLFCAYSGDLTIDALIEIARHCESDASGVRSAILEYVSAKKEPAASE